MYPISNEGLNKETSDTVYSFTTTFHPLDSFWVAGPEGNGKNMVGKIWMKIRDSLKLTQV